MERETRFLLLTLLLVVLPSLLLSYFGLETIQAETDALQTRFQQTAERFAGEVAGELERGVVALEKPLHEALADLATKDARSSRPLSLLRERLDRVRRIVRENDSLGQILLLDPEGQELEQLGPDVSPVPSRLPGLVEAARLERAGEHAEALTRYSTLAADSALAGVLRARATLGQARCLERLGRAGEAAAAYQQVVERYPTATSQGGWWLAPGAQRRRAELATAPADAARRWLELLTLVQAQRGVIPAEQRRFHLRTAETALARLADDARPETRDGWQRYQQRAASARRARKARQALVTLLAPRARQVISGKNDRDPVGRLTIDDAVPRFFFYARLMSDRGPAAVVFVRVHAEEVVADLLGRTRRYPDQVPRFRTAGGPVGPEPKPEWSSLARHELAQLPIEVEVYYPGPDLAARWRGSQFHAFIWVIALALIGILFGCFVILRAVTRELKQARLKSDFVSNVTHELKTPLTSIRMFVETLQLGRFRTPDQRQECLDRIERETGRLQRLIERVLEFSKIDRGTKTFRINRCDPAEIADQAVRLFEVECAGDYTLTREIPDDLPRIEADLEAVVEVVLNLLQNAYKYSDAPRAITLGMAPGEGDDAGQLRIWVADDGIGIPKREAKRIFRKFYRVDDALDRRADGAGLGLTLCAAIVKAHGGSISLDSEAGRGSTFTVRLPLAAPATPTPAPVLMESASHGDHPGHRG